MARVCEVTGTRANFGNKVSHSNIKTRTRWNANLKSKKFVIPELSRSVTLYVSTGAIRTIDKVGGLTQALFTLKAEKMSDRVQKLKAQILKKRRSVSKPTKKSA